MRESKNKLWNIEHIKCISNSKTFSFWGVVKKDKTTRVRVNTKLSFKNVFVFENAQDFELYFDLHFDELSCYLNLDFHCVAEFKKELFLLIPNDFKNE